MYNTFFEHRRNCGCTRCMVAYKRYEAIGVLVDTIVDTPIGFHPTNPGTRIRVELVNGGIAPQPVFLDRLDALAELLKKRYSN